MTLLVLAAGKSTRFQRVKQLEPIGPSGETLAEYSLWDAVQVGFTRVVFIVPPSTISLFEEVIGRKVSRCVDFRCIAQAADDLGRGTASALLSAEQLAETPFCVINADDHYGRQAIDTLYNFLSRVDDNRGSAAALVAYRLKNTLPATGTVTRGICEISAAGYLRRIVDVSGLRAVQKELAYRSGTSGCFTGEELVSMNLWGFADAPFCGLRRVLMDSQSGSSGFAATEFGIPHAVDRMVLEDALQVQVYETEARCVGLTYPSDRSIIAAHIGALVKRGLYPKHLWR